MLKHLPSSLSAEDYALVKRAHEVMTSQASRINDEKKRAEHAERVEQLQAAIQKWTVDKVSCAVEIVEAAAKESIFAWC